MAKSTLRHPQFFHTLVPGFHTHLVIPVDFFSKYIQGKSVEDTAELKSDSSDITWKVKITGRSLSDGWEAFAVGNILQIGDVLLVRYEGDLVFHVSDLGPNCSETRDVAPPSNRNDIQDVIGIILLKKRLYPRTLDFSSNDDDDDEDVSDTELPRKKRAKKNSPEAEGEAVSSSSLDNSSFVANVTASSLRTDTMYLPEYFTSSNGLTRKCSKIVLIDGGERSWALDLSFNSSSDTFYISRGWRNFCDENGQETGSFFMFKLVGSGETPVLSFCPTEPLSDRKQRGCSEASGRESLATEVGSEEENIIEDDCNSMESLVEIESSGDECSSMETENTKYSPRQRVLSYSSYSPCRKEFVTFTLPPDYVKLCRLRLPVQFTRENGINKPGKIYLLGKGGKKCLLKLLQDKSGAMSLGKGWKYFVKANGIKTGFTVKLLWKDTTPVLCLCDAEFTIDREQEESVFIDSSVNQLVTLTITPFSLKRCLLRLPKCFTTENDINKPGMITLLGKDGIKHQTKLIFQKARGSMALGGGLKSFVKENGLKIGDSFTLELIWEDTSPVLRLCRAKHSIDKRGECSETNQKKSLPREPSICKKISKEESKPMEREKTHLRGRDSTPSSQKQFVTSTTTESLSDRKRKGCSETSGRESFATEVSCEEENIEVESSEEECSSMDSLMEIEKTEHCPRRRVLSYSSYSPCQKRLVTFTLPPDYVRIAKLCLPKEFAKENSINKPGMIYLVDKDGTKWLTNLQHDKKGTMSLGKGWKDFVKANGIKTSFTLKLIWEDTTPLLSLCDAQSTIDREQEDFSKPNEKESLFIDSSNRDKINRDENNKVESMSWERNKNDLRGKYSTPSSESQLVTLTITPDSVSKYRLRLPKCFTTENDINKPGMITLLGKDGIKHQMRLLFDKSIGRMILGSGWKSFVQENGLNMGESFTLKLIWEDTTPLLSLCPAEHSIGKRGECSKTNQKMSLHMEPSSYKKISKDETIKEKNNKDKNIEEENKPMEREKSHLRGRDSTLSSQKQFVTLTTTPSSFTKCRLILPAQFTKENSMNKLE